VAVVAPAGPFDPEKLRQGAAIWRDRGFEVVTHPDLLRPEAYLAAPDWLRADILNQAIADPSIKALLAARGGYGTLRLLDQIDTAPLAASPKVILGFSDLTAWQMDLWRRFELATFSGPMIAGTQLSRLSPSARDQFFAGLMTEAPPPPLAGGEARVVLGGEAEGVLLGGNLTMLCYTALAGRLPPLAGAILLVEDVREAPYRIDRMLTSLRLGGYLNGLAGIAGGDFGSDVDPELVDAIFLDRFGDWGIPIVTGFEFGHGQTNRLIPLGVPARLSTEPPQLAFLRSGVC
jgi:muramoyltetrapeptide carboxypeptidase